jgi:serine/threonine protein kinase
MSSSADTTKETTMQENEVTSQVTGQLTDYAAVLDQYGLTYKAVYPYLQVGEINITQGWILHVSVIKRELPDLIKKIIPFLITEKLAFKIPVNEGVVSNLLEGSLGYTQLGKIFAIYPETTEQAVIIADKLVHLTLTFKGPAIPTDVHLGGAVYTRYGSFNPLMMQDAGGNAEKFIYNNKKQLVKDDYAIPFVMPRGISWPFASIRKFTSQAAKKLINKAYLPYMIIKADAKGRVIKGISIKNLLKIKWCLIKEGKRHMCADEAGRDIHDRLAWQLELHNDLCNDLPIPRIYDYFEEDGNTYLVMQFIEGKSFDHWLGYLPGQCLDRGGWD